MIRRLRNWRCMEDVEVWVVGWKLQPDENVGRARRARPHHHFGNLERFIRRCRFGLDPATRHSEVTGFPVQGPAGFINHTQAGMKGWVGGGFNLLSNWLG